MAHRWLDSFLINIENQMRYVILFFSLLTISCLTSSAQTTDDWTLERCINHALEHNIDLKIQQNYEQKATYNRQQSEWSLLPSVNGWGNSSFDFRRSTNQNNEIASGPSLNTNYGISSSLRLFAGFTSINTIAAYRFNELAVQESSKMAVNKLVISITELFAQVLYQKALVVVLEEQLNISQFEGKRITANIDAGLLEAVAQLEIDATVSGNQLQLNRAQNDYRLMKLRLSQLIEIPENTNFEPVSTTFDQMLPSDSNLRIDNVYKLACENYPAVLQKEFEMDYYRKMLHVSKGNMSPSLTLSGGYSSAFFSTDTLADGRQTPVETQFGNYLNPSVGLSLSIPIFNSRSREINVKRSKIDMENALYSLENQKKLIRREIEEALLRLENLAMEYQYAQKNLLNVEKSFDTYREKYRMGLINTTDFMSAQNQLAVAKSDQTRTKYSWMVQKYTLELYKGSQWSIAIGH